MCRYLSIWYVELVFFPEERKGSHATLPFLSFSTALNILTYFVLFCFPVSKCQAPSQIHLCAPYSETQLGGTVRQQIVGFSDHLALVASEKVMENVAWKIVRNEPDTLEVRWCDVQSNPKRWRFFFYVHVFLQNKGSVPLSSPGSAQDLGVGFIPLMIEMSFIKFKCFLMNVFTLTFC